MAGPETDSAKPKPDAAKTSAGGGGDATRYVGTPAVGTLFEPPTVFKIGYPSDYALGVDTKWQQKYRIWVDRTPDRVFVVYARCTHLGCTPDWKASENKFKCPCHGSGYDSEGVNFEGPAPRPMDRAHVELAPDGQIIVDTSRLYQWPKGQPSHFSDPGSFLPV
jgi:cytochrome b6-f complex iron-sulfur subunit